MPRQNGGRDSGQEEKKARPVHSIRFFTGAATVEAAIWEQPIEGEERITYNVTLTRTYKDGDEYKHSKGFWPQDLPHAALALQAAAIWIAGKETRRE